MKNRTYNPEDLKSDAAIIAMEVISTGSSDGWSGSLEDLLQIRSILSNYNIKYVDDMTGCWQ